tara:strand:+ start:2361 stop:3185 length:825 start_codon:yes stop_codon:yes gene_type:complete
MSKSLKVDDKKVSYKEKKQLEKDIVNLTANEHTEILNIIRNNNQKYSENNAGVYINLKYVDQETIRKIINFVKFCKKNKETDEDKDDSKQKRSNKKKRSTNILGKNFTLNKEEVTNQLQRLKDKKQENFSFQNFLDKLSITNIKQFKKNEKIVYPQLKQSKKKFEGVSERLLKKCRDVNRIQDNKYTDNLSEDDSITDSIDTVSNNVDTVMTKSLFAKISIDEDVSDEDDESQNIEYLDEEENVEEDEEQNIDEDEEDDNESSIAESDNLSNNN